FDVVRITDRFHEPAGKRRAFASVRRHHRFDLLRVPTRGFTPAGHRQVQFELDWRSHCAHETSGLLALSINPLSGTVRAFIGLLRPLCPLLTSASRSGRLATPPVPKGHGADLPG